MLPPPMSVVGQEEIFGNVYENTDEEVLKQVVNMIQSVLSEFIADGLNEGVLGEVGGRSMMQ